MSTSRRGEERNVLSPLGFTARLEHKFPRPNHQVPRRKLRGNCCLISRLNFVSLLPSLHYLALIKLYSLRPTTRACGGDDGGMRQSEFHQNGLVAHTRRNTDSCPCFLIAPKGQSFIQPGSSSSTTASSDASVPPSRIVSNQPGVASNQIESPIFFLLLLFQFTLNVSKTIP